MRGKPVIVRGPRAAGFTLVEVMVSAGISMVIILVMLATMLSGTQGYDQATRRIDALVEARAAMGVMSDDVSTLVSISEEEFGWQASDERFHEIWFLTLKPEGAQDPAKSQGDVCYVHYFTAVTRDLPLPDAAFSRKLYRRFLSSADLVENLRNGTLPTPVANVDEAEAVAFNVTRFVAQPLMANTTDGVGGALIPWTQGGGPPESLAIEFQVVDGDTADMLKTEADWNLDTVRAQNLIAENGLRASLRGRDFQLNLKIGRAN